MNRSRRTLAILGGIFAAMTLAAGVAAYLARSDRGLALSGDYEEGIDGLENMMDKARTLSARRIYPAEASVRAIEGNEAQLIGWRDDALRLAARGDRIPAATTPAAFKAFIIADAQRLGALAGAVAGRLTQSDFAFGSFKEFITESRMPTEAELPFLQRQWGDVAAIVEQLAAAGIAELVDVQFKGGVKDAPDGADGYTYEFAFRTGSRALAQVFNALCSSPRFTVIDSFAFGRERDVVAEALSGPDKSERGPKTRGRRRGARVDAEAATAAPRNRVVTDPAAEEPFKAVLQVSVYDFRTAGAAATGEVR